MAESKRCNSCGETKPVSEFYKRGDTSGYQYRCKVCAAAYGKRYKMSRPFYSTLKAAKHRAKARDLPFSITEEYLESIWTGVCPVFQVRLNLPLHGEGHKYTTVTPSLDRLVPDRGYVPGNVIWISMRANQIKSNASSAEILAVGAWLQQTEEEIAKHEAD